MTAALSIEGAAEDHVATFQIDGEPVRGRIVRLGETADAILRPHAYPVSVARLVGEAVMIAALVGDALKFEGRLIVQATGDGPVNFVVADYDTSARGVRAYAKISDEKPLDALANEQAGADVLLGSGTFAMTVSPDGDMERYQGLTAIEGESLAQCAEAYFRQSEQVPTRIRLAVGRLETEAGAVWRAGGALIQRVAEDEARGSAQDAWETAETLFATVGDDELLDPRLTMADVLFRLFHETGVRLGEPHPVNRRCTCDPDRLRRLLASFTKNERAEMVQDGRIEATCEYCKRVFQYDEAEITALAIR
ncbi:MAG: Hsp33 family molecular chaperone [Maricaulaceae bacterium]